MLVLVKHPMQVSSIRLVCQKGFVVVKIFVKVSIFVRLTKYKIYNFIVTKQQSRFSIDILIKISEQKLMND